MKKIYIVVSILIGVIVVILGLKIIGEMNDKQKFVKTEKELSFFERTLNVKQESITTENSCSYANRKFDKGSPSCVIQHNFISEFKSLEELQAKSDTALKKMRWEHRGSNLEYLQDHFTGYIGAELYNGSTLQNCHVWYKQQSPDQPIRVEIGCSSPAKQEWFPVRSE